MSSDLVKRLRDRQVCSPPQNACRNDWCMDEAAARIEALEAALAEATRLMTEASREAGEWKGKYEAAGYPGALDGWIERTKAAEAENLKLSGLLCIIHRDGGHYIAEHGLDKALADAHLIWAELIQCYEENGPEAAKSALKGQSDD